MRSDPFQSFDLLPITLRGSRMGKQYKLVVPAGLKAYKDAERAEPADLTFDMPADGLRLFVEAGALGEGTLSLQLLVGQAVIQSDRAKVTAFRWFGPLNVPEHAIYQFKVATPPTAESRWVEPVGGTLWTSSLIGPSDVTIKWGAGPTGGKARYKVNDNYTWGLNVNIVEVVVEKDGAGAASTAGNVVDDGLGQDAGGNVIKKVKANGPASRGLRRSRLMVPTVIAA